MSFVFVTTAVGGSQEVLKDFRKTHFRKTDFWCQVMLWLVPAVILTLPADAAEEQPKISFTPAADAVTDVSLVVTIKGTMETPSSGGPQTFDLTSKGQFEFREHRFPVDAAPPLSLRSVREFRVAGTETKVGSDHTTAVELSRAYRLTHAYGSPGGIQVVSPRYAMTRQQLDLLELPFDILAADALLPSGEVSLGETWNTDVWVVPLLTGIEAVVEQKATCRLVSLADNQAVVEVTGNVEGAVRGSVSEISFSGQLTYDVASRIISAMKVTQKEKRTAGPVSPGLDVTAVVQWSQKVSTSDVAVAAPTTERPTEKDLQLYLRTPSRLIVRHSREWHIFHQTPTVLMMRQLRNGSFLSQCNISAVVAAPPGEHTPDAEFLDDVTAAVKERKGKVVNEETIRDDDRWRIRHVQAVGHAADRTIIWDYFLCTAGSGEQYSLVFSHSQNDDEAFGDSAMRILNGLQVIPARPRVPLPGRSAD